MMTWFLTLILALQELPPLIDRLGDERVEVRELASREIRSRLAEMEPLLRDGLAHADAEVRARCSDLLAKRALVRKPLALGSTPTTTGRLSFLDMKEGRMAIDRRLRDGVMVGDEFEIYRGAERVGRARIIEVQAWGSWAKPCEGTDFSKLQRGDGIIIAP